MKIKDALLFLVALGVAAAFSKPLPVKVDVKPKKTNPAPTPKKAEPKPESHYNLREPKTNFEHTVMTICGTALSMDLDTYKFDEAKKIYSMTDNRDSQLTDDEVNYAIGALNLICRSMNLSYYKSDVTNLICKLTSGHMWD